MTERLVALFGHSGLGHSLVILVWSLVIPKPALHLSMNPEPPDSARRTQRLYPYRRRCALERKAGPVSILLAAHRAHAGPFGMKESWPATDLSDEALRKVVN